ncbi:rhodanese-like domain-containing protein [Ruminococcaceae bacterium OttesenSCG-928-D13]|nr:rhodanese-like domain-containing protein [Ruminococcaceae bacterium OttesenSCG-928-D13]
MFGFLNRMDINKGVEEFRATDGAVLLDVRTENEYRGGHVPGSRNIEVNQIEKVAKLASDKATPLFVLCLSGARSGHAVNALKSMGYTNAKNIGGISAYTGPLERNS